MKRHSMLQAPGLAFYSWGFYREVAETWRGTSFAYLLLLLAVCWLPTGWQVQSGWAKMVDDQSPRFVDQIPPIVIKDGVVSVDAKQPCYITDPGTKKVLAIIDTTGQVAPLDRTGALVFIGKDQVVVKKGANETRVYSLSGIEELHFDRDIARLWLGRSKYESLRSSVSPPSEWCSRGTSRRVPGSGRCWASPSWRSPRPSS